LLGEHNKEIDYRFGITEQLQTVIK
jgi:hypothetical protein